MSAILAGTGAAFNTGIIAENDDRGLSDMFRADVELVDLGDGTTPGSYVSPWWPGGNGFYGDFVNDIAALEAEGSWGFPDLTKGHSGRFGVTGITRDAYGSPLAFVTVKLYRTSTDEMVCVAVSDANGNYLVTTPYYPDGHYIVTYKTGTPDVFGTSVNTLVGG